MKLKQYILIALAVLVFNACENYLDEDPKGRITGDYTKTEEGLQDLVIAQYYSTRHLPDDLMIFGVYGSDIFTWGMNGQAARLMTECRTEDMISNGDINTFWKHCYEALNNINWGLSVLPEVDFASEASKNVTMGELSFLRAFYYHLIVETWGAGAHYTTEPYVDGFTTEWNQVPVENYYKLILSDIDNAITNLPQRAAEWGRLSEPAAKAMKSRILLALAGYDEAVLQASGYSRSQLYQTVKQLCDEVINGYGLRLLDDFASIFDVYNEENSEVIWSIQYTENRNYNTTGQQVHRYWVPWYNRSARTYNPVSKLPSHSILYGREYRWNMATKYYLELFDRYDKRFDGTFQTVWMALDDEQIVEGDTAMIRSRFVVTDAEAAVWDTKGIAIDGINHIYDMESGIPTNNGRSMYHTMTKHLDPSRTIPKEEQGYKDVIMLRLGDVYLMAAEAAYMNGQSSDAAGYITQLRKRALVSGYESALAVDPTEITIDYILDERARELGGEFLRFFDLKRTGKFYERIKRYNPDALYIEQYHVLRPVPLRELETVTNRNEVKQNPGYE